jgi:N-acetylgalactosamine-N,N'-diacetylbacillosaminyl-diphospho-undecaprenol 4-alpha-N-acetylgalactosaminyltransferase
MEKKKIAFFINSMSAGGAEKVVSLVIGSLRNEFDIHLILLNPTIEVDFDQSAVHLKSIDTAKIGSGGIMDIVKMPFLALRLKRYLRQQGIGHCISFLNRPNFITAIARLLGWKGRSILCERVHTSSYYNQKSLAGRVGQWLVRNLYNHCDMLIVNAEGMAVDLREHFGVKRPIRVIYNSIDLATTQQKAAMPVSDQSFDEFTFILPGRFHPQKNHGLLVAAVQQIAHLPFKVLLVGKGETEAAVREAVSAVGLQHKIIFAGFQSNPLRYVSKSHCVLLTSDFEGFPNVLLEALACGRPIISTDCLTGPRELLSGRFQKEPATDIEQLAYGILVPVNDKDALARAMQLVIENPALLSHYAAVSQQRAADFDLAKTVTQFADAIHAV